MDEGSRVESASLRQPVPFVAMDRRPVLNSWKEIADFVGRGVRTLQRWEKELGFPVRRPRGKTRSPVIAVPAELEAWLRSTPAARAATFEPHGNHALSGAKMRTQTEKLIEQVSALCGRAERLQAETQRAIVLSEAIRARHGKNSTIRRAVVSQG